VLVLVLALMPMLKVSSREVFLARWPIHTGDHCLLAGSLARYLAALLLSLVVVDAYVLPVAPLASASSSPLSHLHTT